MSNCRPPGNRDPKADEIEACAPRLEQLVAALQPDGMVVVGKVADVATSRPWAKGITQVVIRHPASLLYSGHPNPRTLRTLRGMVGKVRRLMVRLGADTTIEAPVDGDRHEHEPVPFEWVKEGRTLAAEVCGGCGVLLSAPPGLRA